MLFFCVPRVRLSEQVLTQAKEVADPGTNPIKILQRKFYATQFLQAF